MGTVLEKVWILSPITYIESALGGGIILASMSWRKIQQAKPVLMFIWAPDYLRLEKLWFHSLMFSFLSFALSLVGDWNTPEAYGIQYHFGKQSAYTKFTVPHSESTIWRLSLVIRVSLPLVYKLGKSLWISWRLNYIFTMHQVWYYLK